MDIKVTKKQNVKVDGVKYKAVLGGTCTGCAFDDTAPHEACGRAPCHASSRDDGREVIFVKKESKWVAINGVVPYLRPSTRVTWKTKDGRTGGTCTAEALSWSIGDSNEVTHYRIVEDAAR